MKRYRVSDGFDDIIGVSDTVDEKIQGVRRSCQVGTGNNTRGLGVGCINKKRNFSFFFSCGHHTLKSAP